MRKNIKENLQLEDEFATATIKLVRDNRAVVGMVLPEGVVITIPAQLAEYTGFGRMFVNYEPGPRTIWMLSDIVESMIVDENTFPLLTPTPLEFTTQSKFVHEYVAVRLDRFDKINLRCVTNLETLEPMIDTFKVYITLHFKPYKQHALSKSGHQDEH